MSSHKTLLIIIAVFFVSCLFSPLSAQRHWQNFMDMKYLDVNNIFLSLTNHGTMGDGYTYPFGAFWDVPIYFPHQLLHNRKIIFDQGVWLVGLQENKINVVFEKWFTLYEPGPIVDGKAAIEIHPEDSLRFRMYRITRGDDSSNPDYAEWPADLGAPVDKNGNPLFFGDQMLWTVYNGAAENCQGRDLVNDYLNENFRPMPVEIHQLAYAQQGDTSNYFSLAANVVFFEWTLINKGDSEIDSAYFGFWTDIDMFEVWANNPQVDSAREVGYCWSDVPGSPEEGIPPAVGYTLLYGPVAPSPNDSAIFKGRFLPNYKNLPMTSFHPIGDDGAKVSPLSEPKKLEHYWHVARGLDISGDEIIDPTTGKLALFPYNGDPVTNSGWINPGFFGGGAGFVFFSGPFNFAPGDTQWVMIALVPAIGQNRFDSITKMRKKVDLLHSLPYDSLAFGKNLPTKIYEKIHETPIRYELSQNYPNPFNSSTIITYSIAKSSFVKLSIFNIRGQEVATLVDKKQPSGRYRISVNMKNLPGGIYFYQLQIDNKFSQIKKMILIK